ncbi:MAG TPA: hypothetical protein VEL79_09475 [Vicinamibacterales bacterium]|nr:hypothetical protein [Vicinamibacterales bacterium]
MDDHDQRLVSEALGSRPPSPVPADFLARVNARIDADLALGGGWAGLADYRAWTLRLLPMTAGLALIAVFWPGSTGTTSASGSSYAGVAFSPSSLGDWQRDVNANALLDAALRPAKGEVHVR